ncbi:hypothetical protein PX699_00345 [Sphingobium sp. H39-3-25]|uniref:hypothetical protein n=1 Tax=Sphingobium arseniciresistens TaxID=3030834 RepID=UPI0023B902F1|nr:hypothetical protein [Sphingobium arseniciresistens]
MRVETDTGTMEIGQTETGLTIGITDYSRRVTDDFGVTTVVPRGFSRQLSARLGVPSDDVDALQQLLAGLRATPATWVADDRFASLSVRGFYKDFSLDLAAGGLSYCTLTIEGLVDSEDLDDTGADPAPEGQLSRLCLLQPETITDAVLTSSSVAEADHAEWSAGTVYPLGARVIKAATHRIYESTAAGNVGADPAGSSGKWLDVGPTNRWAMFDQALGTVTSAAGSIIVSLDVDAVSAVALLDVVAATVRVEAAGYDRTIAVGEGAVTFLDLPADTSAILVTVTGTGTVSVGTLLAGPLVALGVTEASPMAGITDYSRKETDDFGEVTVVERAWAKRMSTRSLIRTAALDDVVSRITAVRTRPSLWIGEVGTDSLTIYGFFKDFSIEVGETVSKLSLTVEGLSKAAPLPSAPVVLVPRGPYDPATNYGAGDIVQYEGSSWVYVAALASTGNAPPSLPVESNDWWSLFVRAGSDSISGSNRVRNAMFERGVQGWTTGINTGPLTLTSFFAGLHQGVRYVKAEYDAGAAGAQFELRTHSDYAIPVKGSERLAVQLGIEGQGPIDIQHVHAHYVDAAGSVSAVYVAGVSGAQPFNTKLQVFVETPSTAVAMHLVLYVRANAAGHMTAIIAEPMVSSATEIQTGFPSFVPGPADGQDGAPGAPGADGLTLYSWVAYADSADGTVNFATGAPGGRGYQGLAVNKTSAIESTNPTDYTWAPYRGPALFGLVPHANVVVGQDYVLKTSGGSAWNASAYSSEGYVGGAMAGATAQSGDYYMFGLNADPTSNADWTSIDYGFYLENDGDLHVVENGSIITIGAYNDQHALQIVYNNKTVTYYRSGEIVRQISVPSGLRLYFDSSLPEIGSRISDVKFSPVGSAGNDGATGSPGPAGPQGDPAFGFVQDSPTPTGQFVSQTWYRPSSKELYRWTGSAWDRILGALSAQDLIASSAFIGDGVIINAKIGNLQVDSAKIANLTVGTGKITPGALTSAPAAGPSSGTITATYLTKLSITHTPYDANSKLLLLVGGTLTGATSPSGAFYMARIRRDGATDVYPSQIFGRSQSGSAIPGTISIMALDSGLTGSHTWDVDLAATLNATGGADPASYAGLVFVILELKQSA